MKITLKTFFCYYFKRQGYEINIFVIIMTVLIVTSASIYLRWNYLQNDYPCYQLFWEEAIQLSYKNKQSQPSFICLVGKTVQWIWKLTIV